MAIKILKQFWLGGRIYLADKIENNPDATLTEFAQNEMDKPYEERLCSVEGEQEPVKAVETQLKEEKVVIETSEEKVVDGEDYEFISVDEFKALKVNAQIEYVNEIENADVDEDELYQQLVAYKEVAKSKAKEAIDEVLSSYED